MESQEIRDSLHQIHEKQSDLEREVVKTQTLLEVHSIQEDKAIEGLRGEQSKMSEHLAEYNAQLSVHIAGVAELRKMNELLKEQIDLYKQGIEARMDKIEAPGKWLRQTKTGLLWAAAIIGSIVAISNGGPAAIAYLGKLIHFFF